MADRLLGLVGDGRGPVLRTARMKKPTLHIQGEAEDWQVIVECDSHTYTFNELGRHQLRETNWLQIEAKGANCRKLICTVHEGK
jgi:hypothetical protein